MPNVIARASAAPRQFHKRTYVLAAILLGQEMRSVLAAEQPLSLTNAIAAFVLRMGKVASTAVAGLAKTRSEQSPIPRH